MVSLLEESGSHIQVLIPVLLICAGCIISLIFHWRRDWCFYIAILVTSICFVAAWALFLKVIGSNIKFLEYFPGHSWSGDRFLKSGQPIGIVIHTDILGSLLVLLITGIGLLVTLYSHTYIPHSIKLHRIGYYYSLLMFMLAGLVGICLTGDCFNFYVFLEVASISSYALVAMPHTGQSLEAAFKYILIGGLGSILLVFGISLLFAATGTLNMVYASSQIEKIINAPFGSPLIHSQPLIFASLALLVIGLCIKSAFFPAHAWLADAHPAAPSSVSAILSGLVVKATGVYMLIRFLFPVFGVHKNPYGVLLSPIFLILAATTIIAGSICAIAQKELKRMLAYSTIAQMGYILIGIGLLTQAGLEGAILHILNHAMIKSLLFMCAGAIIYKTGIRNIRDMTNMGYRMPLTMGCFTVGALAMVGVPPLNGFMSKWALAEAALDAQIAIVVVVLLISSLLNAIYYFRVVAIAYFPNFHRHSSHYKGVERRKADRMELYWQMAVPLLLLASALLLFGLKVKMLREIIKMAVVAIW